MTDMPPSVWVSVSRAALRHNVQVLRDWLAGKNAKTPRIIAVVKADAFGHGMVEAARTFTKAGVDFLAVTTPAEGWELRQGGLTERILVFLPPLLSQIEIMVESDMEITITDEGELTHVADAARRLGKTARVHLKVDTGMGRIGVLPSAASAMAQKIADTRDIEFASLYTHFARALDKDPTPTRRQFAKFQQVTRQIEEAGIAPGLRHCANSAATLRFPEMHLDAVRPGTILYGQYPSAAVPKSLALKDGWRLQARVVSVRDVPTGTTVGYGGEFVTRRPTRLAVLPIGYADGFTVAPASATAGWRGLKALVRPVHPAVTIHGKRAPVVGRVSMQVCTVDVSDIPGVSAGDIATVPARRITVSARLPRVYED